MATSDNAGVRRADHVEIVRPPAGRRRWRIFFILLAAGTISYIDRSSISVGMPLIAKDFHVSPAMTGVLISVFFWTYTLFLVPSGILADKFGARKVLGIVLTIWAFVQAGTGLAWSVAVLIVLRLLLGVFEAPYYPAASKLSGAWLPQVDRGRGAALADSSSALGGAVGGLVVATLIDWYGNWREPFVIVGVISSVMGLIAWVFIRNSPAEDPKVSAEEREYIETQLAAEAARSNTDDSTGRATEFLRFRTFWAMGGGFFAGNIVFYGLLTYGPIYLYQARGLDLKHLAWATFVIYGAGFVGENLAGWLTQRWRRSGASANRVMRTTVGASAALTTAAIVGVAYVSSGTLAVALMAVTLFFLRVLGMYWVLPATLGGARRAGVLAGMMNVFSNVGGILAPLVIGFIVQATGSYFLGLMFFAAMGLIYTVCSLIINWGDRLPIGRGRGSGSPSDPTAPQAPSGAES